MVYWLFSILLAGYVAPHFVCFSCYSSLYLFIVPNTALCYFGYVYFILVHWSLCNLLFALISSGLYSIRYFVLTFGSQCLYAILQFFFLFFSFFSLFSLLFQCLYAMSFFSSILTFLFNVYTLSLTISGIQVFSSSQSLFPHCCVVIHLSTCLLVAYFVRPSIISLAASNSGCANSFPSSSIAVHECTGISALER